MSSKKRTPRRGSREPLPAHARIVRALVGFRKFGRRARLNCIHANDPKAIRELTKRLKAEGLPVTARMVADCVTIGGLASKAVEEGTGLTPFEIARRCFKAIADAMGLPPSAVDRTTKVTGLNVPITQALEAEFARENLSLDPTELGSAKTADDVCDIVEGKLLGS